MKIHHVGYAVRDINTGKEEFGKLGYKTQGDEVADTSRNVAIQFMSSGEYLVELIAPLGEKSPVDNILKKVGNSPYHICYEVEDIKSKVAELENIGYMLLSAPCEAPAIGGRKVCFLHSKDMGLIELVGV